MKRLLSALLCAALLLTIHPIGATAHDDIPAILLMDEVLDQRLHIQAIASYNQTLYIKSLRGVHRWRPGESEARLILPMKHPQLAQPEDVGFHQLLAEGGLLFGLNTIQGLLYPLTDQGDRLIIGEAVSLDWSDFREQYRTLHLATIRGNSAMHAESRLDLAERIVKPRSLGDLANPNSLQQLQARLLAGAESLRKKPRSPHTVKGYMNSVLSAVNWAYVQGWLPAPPRLRKIKVGKLRGVQSFGMLCSSRELGLSDDHGGLLELPADRPRPDLRDPLRAGSRRRGARADRAACAARGLDEAVRIAPRPAGELGVLLPHRPDRPRAGCRRGGRPWRDSRPGRVLQAAGLVSVRAHAGLTLIPKTHPFQP